MASHKGDPSSADLKVIKRVYELSEKGMPRSIASKVVKSEIRRIILTSSFLIPL